MESLFLAILSFFIFVLSPIGLIVGLIKPSIFSKLFRGVPKRRSIVFLFLGLGFISMIGVGIFTPKDLSTNVQKDTNNVASQNIDATSSDSNTEIKNETVTTTLPKNSPPPKTADIAHDVSAPVSPSIAPVVINTPVVTKVTPQATTPKVDLYSVTKVVDGDTIKVSINGIEETLRLIGIDTPESVDPRKPVQCFGIEASNRAKELLSGKKVRLEADPTQGERDKYNRLLRYVWMEDGTFFNKKMILDGYAHEYTYNIPYKYQTEFKQAQKIAESNQSGLWSPNTCNGDTTSAAASTVTATTAAESSSASQTGGKYYTSSYRTSKYYYPASCPGWQNLSPQYLESFDSLEALLQKFPSRSLSPQCD